MKTQNEELKSENVCNGRCGHTNCPMCGCHNFSETPKEELTTGSGAEMIDLATPNPPQRLTK